MKMSSTVDESADTTSPAPERESGVENPEQVCLVLPLLLTSIFLSCSGTWRNPAVPFMLSG